MIVPVHAITYETDPERGLGEPDRGASRVSISAGDAAKGLCQVRKLHSAHDLVIPHGEFSQ